MARHIREQVRRLRAGSGIIGKLVDMQSLTRRLLDVLFEFQREADFNTAMFFLPTVLIYDGHDNTGVIFSTFLPSFGKSS
ncbi:MAG: hypothetical protein FWC50_00770 [Planctomycetaceae bacterium]|nr:hypothetical protein [Planctomycetaceae bacterium]